MEMLLIKNCDEKTMAISYKRSLPSSNCLYQSLMKMPTKDMESFLDKAEKCAKLEDETMAMGTMMIDAPPDLRSKLSH